MDERLNVAKRHIYQNDRAYEHKSHDSDIENIQKNEDFFDFLNNKNTDENRYSNLTGDMKVIDDGAKLDSNIPPVGYIRLYLEGIDINQLFLKHNITLKYLDLGGKLYIKSFILGQENREIDCYSEGENQSISIKKKNDSQLSVKLLELGGGVQDIAIVNGVIIG